MLYRKDHDSYSQRVLEAAIRTEQTSAMARPQSAEDFELLQQSHGGFTLETQPEILHYAAILLRAQHRIEQVRREAGLCMLELIWCALYPHLRTAGYTLPLRYAPLEIRKLHEKPSEDRFDRPFGLFHMNVLPAVCEETGARVALKITCSRADTPCSQELAILRLLNEEPLRSHPDNHTVRLLDVVDFPHVANQPRASSLHIVVMPMLEQLAVIDCAINGFALHLMRQTFRAVAFLHSVGICHRDIGAGNLMVTPGNRAPYRLQLIDFGCSQQFDLRERTVSVRWYAGQIPPPEVKAHPDALYDPFSAEMYSLSETWKAKSRGMLPPEAVDLLKRMASDDPATRPSAADCVRDLEKALTQVGIWKQCQPAGLFLLSVKLSLWFDHDPRGLRYFWSYSRAVCSYVLCKGWKYLR